MSWHSSLLPPRFDIRPRWGTRLHDGDITIHEQGASRGREDTTVRVGSRPRRTAASLGGMTSLAHVRTAVRRLADVDQGTHFGMESWSVAGQGFLAVTKDRAAIQFRLSPADAQQVLTDIPGTSLLTRGETVLGVTIPLDAMNGMQANAVIGRSWAYRAPKRLTMVTDQASRDSDLPRNIGRPATAALNGVGIATLPELAAHTEAEIAALHGVGPRAIRVLTEALAERNLTWSAG